jgi:hypothetical protein
MAFRPACPMSRKTVLPIRVRHGARVGVDDEVELHTAITALPPNCIHPFALTVNCIASVWKWTV